MYVITTSSKRVECHFFTLVIKNEALHSQYVGGLKGLLDKYGGKSSRDLTVVCFMGDDIDYAIGDLLASGLTAEADFTVVDAGIMLMGIEAMKNDLSFREMMLDTGPLTPWLKASYENGRIFVELNAEEETNS